MTDLQAWLVNATADAEWQVWHQDNFDRETPRQVDVAGRGLVTGLTELWARHLFSTVRMGGWEGFSHFNLWWTQEQKSVRVRGPWDGMVRLREWIFGDKQRLTRGYVEEGDRVLLKRIAAAHGCLIVAGQSSEVILRAAKDSADRDDFDRRLESLAHEALKLLG